MNDLTINGKSTELWINGRQVLADRVVSGTWTKIGTWTLPAFVAGGAIDMNGLELILDADGDTSITADIDDQIDFKVSGADNLQLIYYTLRATRVNDAEWYNSMTFTCRRARGTVGSEAVVAVNDSMGGLVCYGHDGTAYLQAAAITAEVDGTPGTNDMPTRLLFQVTADGALSPTEAMRINNDKSLQLVTNLKLPTGYIEHTEIAAPGVGAANTARIYAVVGGDTLTDLAAVFQDGTVDIFAQESTPLDSPIFTQPSGATVVRKMLKPHPGIIQFVEVYPDGKTFVVHEIQYHDAEKIAANLGCVGTLPVGWEVTTLKERVDKQVAILDAKINSLTEAKENIKNIDTLENIDQQINKLLEKRLVELARIS